MPQTVVRRFLRHGMLPQLAVFESAARLGSFTRAAEELHLAQPTVSTQLKKLSETLGVPLFEQIGKKVHLTPAGAALRAGCGELFAAFSRIEDTLKALRTLEEGRLQLAVSSSCKYLAPRLLGAFVASHPSLQVSLQIHNREALLARLARNEDDIYIFSNPPTDCEIVSQPIFPNPMVVFARADHPLARRKAVPLAEVAAEPFLLREPGSGTREVALEAFAQRGLKPRVRMELSTNEAIQQAILAGLGVSILPRHTYGLLPDHEPLAVLDVVGMPIQRHWQFVYPQGKHIAPAPRAFMDFVRNGAAAVVGTTRALS